MFQAAGVPFPPSSWEDKTWTVDAMRSTALKLTSDPGQANATYGLTVQNNDTGWGMESWLWGGDPYSADGYVTGYPSQCHFDAPPVQSSYTYFTDLIVKDHVSPSADDVKSMALSKAPFIEQRSAMHMVGGWFIENLKGVVKFNLGVAAFPRATTNVAPIWPDSYVMSATTRHPDQAWTLLRYLIGTEGQQGYMQSTGEPPSDQRLLDQWYKLYTLIPTAELKQALEGSFVNARIIILKELVDFVHIDSVLEPLLTPMYQGKVTVATTLQQVQRAITTALAPNVGKRLCSSGASFAVC